MGNRYFYPHALRMNPTCPKMSMAQSQGMWEIIAWRLCRIPIHIPVVFRWRGMNGDLGNELQYRVDVQTEEQPNKVLVGL